MKKWFVIIVVLAVLGAGGYFAQQKWQHQQRQAKLAKQPKTAKVESRDISFAITSAGDIGPADQVSVRPEVNGRIAELPVDIGDSVKKGDLLCRLDDQDLQTERSSQITQIEGAKLQLEKTRRAFERSKRLYADNLIAKETYEDAKTEFELASNSLQRAQSSLKIVEDRISKTMILAPFDCTVLTRPVSSGQAVSGSGGFNSGTEIMTIANLTEMIILAHISQADVTHLHSGQEVKIELDSVPGLKMTGTIERVAPQATIKNNLKGFSARISLKKIDPRVRPGMTANLSIPIQSAEGVTAVPLAAVFTDQGQRYAYVKKNDEYERRVIEVGISDFNYAEVTSGLAPGDVITIEQPDSSTDAPAKPAADKVEKKVEQKTDKTVAATNAPTTSTSAPRRPVL